MEVVEIDYQPFLSRKRPPKEIEEDLKRCNALWISVPSVPEGPHAHTLVWMWKWRDWEWAGQPSIPMQAVFEESVLVQSEVSEGLEELAEKRMSEALLAKIGEVEFALLLCVRRKYIQGISPGEPGFSGKLMKAFGLLGRVKR